MLRSVLAVQPLLVGSVPPRLAMARAEMLLAVDARDPASVLDAHDPLLEHALTTTGEHDRSPLRVTAWRRLERRSTRVLPMRPGRPLRR